MMPLWPLALILIALGVVAIGQPVLIYHAHRKDKASQGNLQAAPTCQDSGGDVAVSTLQDSENR